MYKRLCLHIHNFTLKHSKKSRKVHTCSLYRFVSHQENPCLGKGDSGREETVEKDESDERKAADFFLLLFFSFVEF